MHKFSSRGLKQRQSTKQKQFDVKKDLPENGACYVLITCSHPSEDGKMEVEMTYQGDPLLAAYLVESAQQFIEVE